MLYTEEVSQTLRAGDFGVSRGRIAPLAWKPSDSFGRCCRHQVLGTCGLVGSFFEVEGRAEEGRGVGRSGRERGVCCTFRAFRSFVDHFKSKLLLLIFL